MKFSKIFVVLLFVLAIVSCKKDDSPDQFIDSDGDGVVDVNDLCPNIPGTVLDNGCYLITNINLTGAHAFSFYSEHLVTTVSIPPNPPVELISDITGDIFQITLSFTEAGTFTFVGEFLVTVTVEGQPPTSQIVTVDESGTYQANDESETITFMGTGDYLNGVFTVTMFDQSELRLTKEETIIVSDEIMTNSEKEFRFIRE